MKKLLIVLIGLSIVLIISIRMWIHFFPVESISEYVEPVIEEKVVTAPAPAPITVKPKYKQMQKPKPFFKCDKRKYCSQMRSYDEAKYFNDYCPDTKMDGDGDGIPCERQFGRI